MPTYNSGATLKFAIKSILNQSYNDYEILILDNLSTDNTLTICKSFNDQRIKISSESDKGIYDAMNKGIALAKGEWLYFLGSDDELYNNEVLEKINNRINNTNSKIIYGNVLVCGNTGWARDGQIYNGYFSNRKIVANNICHQSLFYRKDIFKNLNGYNTKYKICADHDLNIRAVCSFKFEYVNLIIAKFNSGGMSSGSDDVFIKDFDRILIEQHINILYKLSIDNGNLLRVACKKFKDKKFYMSIKMFLIYVYKITIQKTLNKLLITS